MASKRGKEFLLSLMGQYMKESLLKGSEKEQEKWSITLEISLKASGEEIKKKVKELWIGFLLWKNMKVNGKVTYPKAKELMFGLKVKMRVRL